MRRLAKYHGLGNDFLLFDGTGEGPDRVWGDLAVRLCDRHRGIGADGLIVVLPGSAGSDGSPGSDLTMLLHNADGSRAEMSGNGLRCLALLARDTGLVDGAELLVSTDAGPRRARVGDPSEQPDSERRVSVEIGRAAVGELDLEVTDPIGGGTWRARSVEVGNPHLVLVTEDIEALDLAALGPAIGQGGVNLEWVRARPGLDELDLRVWERGVGVTLACGTGSVAAACAGIAMGLVSGPTVLVHNPGGTLEVDCSGDSAWLSGPAQRIAWLEVNPALLAGDEADAGDKAGADAGDKAGARDKAGADAADDPDDWAVVAEGAVEWHWDWASGAGWGTRSG